MDNHLINNNLQYPFTYNEAYKPLNQREFEIHLNLAINGNEQSIRYIDDCTINRKYGFDMLSKDYFGGKGDFSVCAAYYPTYQKYLDYRSKQQNPH